MQQLFYLITDPPIVPAPPVQRQQAEFEIRIYSPINNDLLNVGFSVTVPSSFTAVELSDQIRSQFPGPPMADQVIGLWLANGERFPEGSLHYAFANREDHRIYAFVGPRGIVDWDAEVKEFYDIFNEEMEILLSPTARSTKEGLCQMALLLHFFRSLGDEIDRFVDGFNRVIRFPPMLTTLRQIARRDPVSKLDVAMFTAAVYYVFHSFVYAPEACLEESDRPLSVGLDRTLEYTLKCASRIGWSPDDFMQNPGSPPAIACIDRGFDVSDVLMPRKLVMPFPYARDVIVEVGSGLGLALVGWSSKPLELTSTIDVISPMNREHPRERIALEVRVHDAALAPSPVLPALFDRSQIAQNVLFMVEDHAGIKPDEYIRLTKAVDIIALALERAPCVTALMMIGESQSVVRNFPCSPGRLGPFVPRRQQASSLRFECFAEGFRLLAFAKDRFVRARNRIVLIGRVFTGQNARTDEVRQMAAANSVRIDVFSLGNAGALQDICRQTGGDCFRIKNICSIVARQDFRLF
jgi:hypothetical protein